MSPMNNRLLRPRASGVHPEAAAWRTAVIANGGSVSGTTLSAVDKFCKAIDAAGIRSRFLRLNLFCGTGLSACLVPLYRGPSRSGTQYGNTTDTNTNFVSGDYVETGASGGLKGNGTNKRLDTGVNGSFLLAGDRHVSAYESLVATTDYSPSVMSGSVVATMHAIGTWTSATGYRYRTHNTVGGAAAATASNGMWLGSDTSSTASVLYKNGTSAGTASGQTAGGSGNTVYRVFGEPTGGEFSEARLGAYSIGLSMTALQVSAFYTAMQAFQTSLSRNV